MNKQEDMNVHERGMKKWDKNQNINQLYEEIAELIFTINKHKRGKKTVKDIAIEICDVEILLERMKYVFDIRKECVIAKKKQIKKLIGHLNNKDL